jgi:hypothetical protein
MKISDKLKKVDMRFTVEMYDNGYLIDVSGRNHSDDYSNARIMCKDVDELLELVQEAAIAERDE